MRRRKLKWGLIVAVLLLVLLLLALGGVIARRVAATVTAFRTRGRLSRSGSAKRRSEDVLKGEPGDEHGQDDAAHDADGKRGPLIELVVGLPTRQSHNSHAPSL